VGERAGEREIERKREREREIERERERERENENECEGAAQLHEEYKWTLLSKLHAGINAMCSRAERFSYNTDIIRVGSCKRKITLL
jgi:hypothetical protein